MLLRNPKRHLHPTYVKILKVLRHAGQHIGRFLLLFVVLAHDSRGVELQLRGLNIEQLLVPNTSNSAVKVPVEARHLDDMLQPCIFPAATIDEEVTVILTEHLTEHSDTDESIKEEEKEIKFSFLKFTSKYSGDRLKTRLRPSEIDQNRRPGQITEDLCRQLAKDAFRIANAHHNARTREATTCLCVVLRDEDQGAKKLVFHNSTDEMQPSMRAKANELMYGIRNAHLAHAEAQFIDFLLYRARQRKDEIEHEKKARHPSYTHILGMGCSRNHCQECDALCKLFLGEGYTAHTSALSELSSSKQIPSIETMPQEEGADLTMTIPVQKYQVAFQGAAVRSGGQHSANYRLSERLQASIRGKSSLVHLDFSALRFHVRGHIFNPEEQAAAQEQEGDIDIEGEYPTDALLEEAIVPAARQKRKATFSP